MSSGLAWCDDSDLGPPHGLEALHRGPNALTWRDAGHLLVSSHWGEIFEFTLP